MTRLDSVERAVADIAAGKAVVVVDDEDRENEGDLIFAAEKATPELVAFMVRYTSGYICVPLTERRLRPARPAADVRTSTRTSTAPRTPSPSTPRTASAPASRPSDRAHTIRLLADPTADGRRLHPARPRGAAARQGRRRAAPARAHRGRRRPGPAGRAAARRARSARSSARRTRATWPRPTSCGSSPTSTTWR